MNTTADPVSQHPQMTRYLANARWFGGKGRDYDVVDVERVATVPGPPTLTIDVLTVQYDDGERELYQMPLSHYDEEQERIAHAYVGSHTHDDIGFAHTYDAVHDREAMAVYLDTFDQTPANAAVDYGELTFHRLAGHVLDTTSHSTLFSGEQSNSSVAFGDDSLLKVFRKVTPGRNPDIEIHAALTEAGNPNVAALYGWVEGTTPSTAGRGRIDLAMIQQFLRTASDGWDLALGSVRNLFAEADLHADEVGGDFAGEAERLGAAVAEVHEVLRERFGASSWSGVDVASAMQARLDAQAAVVPDLAAHTPALRTLFDRLGALGADDSAQRIHGDLHLGQTLRVVHNWKLVDFEGEPAKSLADRVLPDSPWRDVAGMLRSFDYAARAVERDFVMEKGDAADQLAFRASEWTRRNRRAFLEGYLGGRPMSEAERTLVAAYEADKAVYEVGYETRNRPTWVMIPLSALARLGKEPK